MTREEAIEVLKSSTIQQLGYAKIVVNGKALSIKEALETAIKALEQESCEDCVSRQALMDCYRKWQPYMETRLWELGNELKELPSATPQPKQGRWKHKHDDRNDWLECPFCGYGDEGEVRMDQQTAFCPFCGAKLTRWDEGWML